MVCTDQERATACVEWSHAIFSSSCAAAAMLIGRFSVSLEDVVLRCARVLGRRRCPPRVNSVVFDLRAPRIIVAILIGGGLSVAGLIPVSSPTPGYAGHPGRRGGHVRRRSSPCCWTGT